MLKNKQETQMMEGSWMNLIGKHRK